MKRPLAFVALALAIAVLSLLACRGSGPRPIDSGPDATLSLEQSVEALKQSVEALERIEYLDYRDAGHRFAAGAGFTPVGRAYLDPFLALEERAKSWSSVVAASTCITVDTAPPAANGDLADYSVLLKFDHDAIDAAIPCDGGVCSGLIRRFLPTDLHGGQLCVAGGSACAGADGGGIDVGIDGYTAEAGAGAGDHGQIAWNGSAIVLQGCCGATACRMLGAMSILGAKAPAPAGASLLSVSPSTLATTYGVGVPISLVTTVGAATGVTAATLGATALAGCTASTTSLVTCTLPAGTRSAGTASASITSPACPSGCALAGAVTTVPASLVSTTPSTGTTAGGTSVTIVMTAGATGGCGVAPTLDGVSATGCVVVDDQHLTLTSAAGAAGTGNVVVTSASCSGGVCTLASGWTYNAPVTVTAISPASAFAYATDPSGNALTATITGSAFSGSPTVTVNGVACTGASVVSSTSITCTLGATTNPSAVGAGNVVVTLGASSATGAGLFTYYDDPLTILPSGVFVWAEARVCTQSGGLVTAVTDLSGSGNAPTSITSVAYAASDAVFGGTPSWAFNGTSSAMQFAAVANPTSTDILMAAVVKGLSTATGEFVSNSTLTEELRINGNTQMTVAGQAATWTGPTLVALDAGALIVGYGQRGDAGPATSNVEVQNGTPIQGVAGGSGTLYPANTAFAFGARTNSSTYGTFRATMLLLSTIQPTSAQLTKLQTYAHARWGI